MYLVFHDTGRAKNLKRPGIEVEGFFFVFSAIESRKSKDVISEFTGLQVGDSETRPGPGRVRVRVRRT